MVSNTGYPSIDKPWLKYYSEKAINTPLPDSSIYEYMFQNNRDYPNDIAILYLGRKVSYGELFKRIDETVAAFAALKVKPGEIVTVALPSIPEALYVVYALNKMGAVANMIHPLAGEQEMVNYINEVSSRVVVLYEESYKIVCSSLDRTSVEKAIVVSAGESLPLTIKPIYFSKNSRVKLSSNENAVSWPVFIKKGKTTKPATVEKDPNTLAIISHTGGTTGEPKGVMCSDYNVNALSYQIVCNMEYVRQLISLVQLPPFINYSLIESMLAMLAIGFKIALIPKYQPEKLGTYIKQYRPYVICSIPAYWEALLKDKKANTIDMSCLRYAYYGGEAMSIENEQALSTLIQSCGAKCQLLKGLGCTEMMAGATQTYPDCNAEGSVGVPLVRTNCKIVDPSTNEEMSYSEQGEICFSGPTLMMGYYNKQDATDEIVKIHADGQRWLHTGDLGYMNEKGVLYVTGRIKRILMTKGRDGNITKIFPDRIEKVISQHDAVDICCIIGVPDETRINYPIAYVVLKESNLEKDEQITNEILESCKKQLPGYMVPEKIIYKDDLPRTNRGKIDYRALESIAIEDNN